MTRDEEAGVELPVPGEAQAEVPETVEPEDGEGRTVGTALRDSDHAGDVDVDDSLPDTDATDEPAQVASAPSTAETATEMAEVGEADAGDALPADAIAVEVARGPDVPPAADVSTGSTAGSADATASGDAAEPDEATELHDATDLHEVTELENAGGHDDVDGAEPPAADRRPEPADARDGGPEPAALVSEPEATADAEPALTADDAYGDRTDAPEPPADEEPTLAALPTAEAPADSNDRAEPDAEQPAADGAGSTTGDEATAAVLPAPRPEPEYEEVTASYVVQDAPVEMSPSDLRVDFGAHLEANYQRLVAQLYAITLSADQAHSAVQDAYSRAWRNWSVIGRSADPTGWVRRVAVRTTTRSWRHLLARLGFARATPKVAEGLDERTTALLTSLRDLPAPERRSVVLFHMAGLSPGEIAAVEQVSPSTISTRLDRARRVVIGDTSDLLTGVIELPGIVLDDDRGYRDQMSTAAEPAGPLDERWERAESWNGGPDGSWLVSEAPPWDAPNSDEWPRSRPDVPADEPRTGGNAAATIDDERTGVVDVPAYGEPADIDPAAAGSATVDGVAANADGDEQRKDSEDQR